jgi:hypothetical protein
LVNSDIPQAASLSGPRGNFPVIFAKSVYNRRSLMELTSCAAQRLDHLGVVAGVCLRIELIEPIESSVGPSELMVTVGEAVQAMVLNVLGVPAWPA